MLTGRRGFIAGLSALICAPAVVRVQSLMPVITPFHERFSWEVYLSSELVETACLPYLRAGTGDSDINALVFPQPHTRVDRGDALRGADLKYVEQFNIPRLEILKIGDRVVDKRIVGGIAPIIRKTQRSLVDDNMAPPTWSGYEERDEELRAMNPSRRQGWDVAQPRDGETRAVVEARHPIPSARSRQQALAIMAHVA